MVSVTLKRDSQNRVNGFRCLGHAGYAKKGSDIVCSGISALTLTTIAALEKILGLELKIRHNKKSNLLECNWVNDPLRVDRAELIIQVMILGLTDIQEQYPEFIKVIPS
ncbi:MAG: ribosomal-processing cysteine protease Prp [Firmicutes bacterium]|nr:ribosomal-processing cysteine protease Prp [Bacillota bacterium]